MAKYTWELILTFGCAIVVAALVFLRARRSLTADDDIFLTGEESNQTAIKEDKGTITDSITVTAIPVVVLDKETAPKRKETNQVELEHFKEPSVKGKFKFQRIFD